MKYLYLIKDTKKGSFIKTTLLKVEQNRNLANLLKDAVSCYWCTTKKEAEEKCAAKNSFNKKAMQKAINDFIRDIEDHQDYELKYHIWNLLEDAYESVYEITINGNTMTIKDDCAEMIATIYQCGHWGITSNETGSRVLSGSGYTFEEAWNNLWFGEKFDPETRQFYKE